MMCSRVESSKVKASQGSVLSRWESGGLDHLWECQWVAAREKGLCHGY